MGNGLWTRGAGPSLPLGTTPGRLLLLGTRTLLHVVRTVVACVVVLAPLVFPAAAQADTLTDIQKKYQASIAQAQQALGGLTQRRQAQQAVVDNLRGVTNSYATDLKKVDQELFATVNALQEAQASLDRTNGEIETLEGEIAAKQAAVDARANAYGIRLRGLYKFTRTSPLEQLLAARDFSDALQRITMMQAVAQVDNRLLGQLRAEQNDLVTSRTALQQKQAEATALRDDIAQKRQSLEEQRATQASLVAKAQSEQRQAESVLTDFDRQQREEAAQIVTLQSQYQSELQELERQRQEELRRQEEQRLAQATAAAQASAQAAVQRAQATATALARSQPTPRPGTTAVPTATLSPAAAATATALAKQAGSALPAAAPLPGSVQTSGLQPSSFGLIWPVPNPVVTTEFGDSTFAESFHRGIDLAQNLYTPIVAAADGIVLQSGLAVAGQPSQSYGMRVVIAHSTTMSTLYAHMDDKRQPPTVKAGDRVRRGQIIGYIGLTGITSGPHLHFEVQVSGDAKNPRLYLPK